MGIRSYFKGAELARMSSGTYCIVRPLGLVKGGKGLKHHENLLTLTVAGVISRLVEVIAAPFVSPRRAARAIADDQAAKLLDAL